MFLDYTRMHCYDASGFRTYLEITENGEYKEWRAAAADSL